MWISEAFIMSGLLLDGLMLGADADTISPYDTRQHARERRVKAGSRDVSVATAIARFWTPDDDRTVGSIMPG